MPLEPTQKDIEGRFPTSLVFVKPEQGAALVLNSRYVGRDYGGRWGNYFSHGLFFDAPKRTPAFAPIDFWGADVWTKQPSATSELPAIANITPQPAELGDLVSFLTDHNPAQSLPLFVAAVELALLARRRIILVDKDEDQSVAAWIGVISRLLPWHLVWDLSFSTYNKNPASTDALIVGTTKDSDFSFSAYEINFQYSVLDFESSRFSPLELSPFASLVQTEVNEGRIGTLFEFGKFAGEIAPGMPVEDLAAAFRVWRLTHDAEIEQDKIAEVAGFCGANSGTLPNDLVVTIAKALAKQAASSPQALTELAGLHAAALKKNPQQAELMAFAYLNAVFEAIPDTDLSTLAGVLGSFPENAVMLNLAAAERGQWLRCLRDCQQGLRFCAVAEWGGRLQLAKGLEEQLEVLGEEPFAMLLRESATQKAWQLLANTSVAGPLLRGIARYLASHSLESDQFAVYIPWLKEGQTNGFLSAHGRKLNAVEMVCRLEAIRADQKTPAQIFENCLRQIEDLQAELTPLRVEWLCELVWGAAGPPIQQVSLVLDRFQAPTLVRTSIVAKLARIVLKDGNSAEPAGMLPLLIDRLLDKPYRAGVGEDSLRLQALREILELRTRKQDEISITALRKIFEQSTKFAPEDRTAILQLATARLLNFSAAERLPTFKKATEPHDQLFVDVILVALEKRLRARLSVEELRDLISNWLILRRDSLIEKSVLDRQFVQAVHSLRKGEKEQFESNWKLPPQSRADWEQLLSSIPPEGMLSKIARWF
jgi:hypothetical protein